MVPVLAVVQATSAQQCWKKKGWRKGEIDTVHVSNALIEIGLLYQRHLGTYLDIWTVTRV